MAYRNAINNKELDKHQPPQSLDTEKAVLGAILKDPEGISRALEVINSPEHFYHKRHQVIYAACLALYEKSEPIDITTVAAMLTDDNTLERIGGRVYLVELVEDVVTTAHINSHCKIVLEKSLLRKLISTSNQITASCYELDQPVDEIVNLAEESIFAISSSKLKKSFVSFKELMPNTFQQIEDLQSDDSSLTGIKTGFHKLDEMTNGLHNGELIILAGRPSMGKSALMMNIAEHVAMEQNKPVAVFSLEMSDEALALRMLCGRARISQQRLRARKLRSEEWPKLTTVGGILAEAPIYIDDSPTLTSLEMRAKARRLISQHDIGLIMVDYIQMMHSPGKYENRQQEMSNISRSLKVLAKEMEVPVIALSQLSRMVEQRGGDKKPVLSDLRESGAIEQDADLVLFVYREEHYMAHVEKTDPKFQEVEGKAEVIVAKQRNGPTGVVKLAFVKDYARFENLDPGYREVPPGVDAVDMGDMGDAPF